jgi:hypothetical protein
MPPGSIAIEANTFTLGGEHEQVDRIADVVSRPSDHIIALTRAETVSR